MVANVAPRTDRRVRSISKERAATRRAFARVAVPAHQELDHQRVFGMVRFDRVLVLTHPTVPPAATSSERGGRDAPPEGRGRRANTGTSGRRTGGTRRGAGATCRARLA